MRHFRQLSLFIMTVIVGNFAHADWICDELYLSSCNNKGSSSQSANPSTGSRVRINPAAVPVEKGFGIESLLYRGEVDLALVTGLGRAGAAISPTNGEETFFGPPGLETSWLYLERKQERTKYKSPKLNLATALQLYTNKKSGLKRFELNLGVMGKYNRDTNRLYGGGGVTGILGPFTFGYSAYGDESRLDDSFLGIDQQTRIRYHVEAATVGIYLNSLIVDYSTMRLYADEFSPPWTITALTACLRIKHALFTASLRTEKSSRPAYNYGTQTLETLEEKREAFGGAQLRATDNLMLSAFYNYYLLRELSFGATLLF